MKLNLGCGRAKLDGYLNIDSYDAVQPDLLCDIVNGLPFPDDSVDEIRADDFLEHVPADRVIFVVEEIYRVLKHGGVFVHITPSTDGRGAFQDPTHRSFWNINSWEYFTWDAFRELYGIRAKFAGRNRQVATHLRRHIIHVRGVMVALKDAGDPSVGSPSAIRKLERSHRRVHRRRCRHRLFRILAERFLHLIGR